MNALLPLPQTDNLYLQPVVLLNRMTLSGEHIPPKAQQTPLIQSTPILNHNHSRVPAVPQTITATRSMT